MFLRLSGRMRLNSQSLNAQGGGGTNYVEITKAKVSIKDDDKWKILEVPAISGNMVKHWHFVNFVDFFRETEYGNNLTEKALRYNGARFGQETKAKKANGSEIELKDESEIIKNFADADVHGFLAPKTGVRRVSLVKTSFLLPTEDFIKEVDERLVYAVKHNRVDVDEKGAIKSGEEQTAQMLFNREYATGLYGFEIILDLGFVGIPQSSPLNLVIEEDERKARIKSALKALIPMLSGYIGANLARAFPVFKLEEFIAVVGEKPIPALVHGFYEDYVEVSKNVVENAKKIGFDIEAFGYNVGFGEDISSVEELISIIIENKKVE
ncbi:CRISPR-associated protein Cas7/Cst2/DevR [Methanocaldococcus lauensis]|nr:CRISPR-associated protein Cas7/Cst2/DevR [Methanocaldococcus lauensis]